jgi:hypothetical protein
MSKTKMDIIRKLTYSNRSGILKATKLNIYRNAYRKQISKIIDWIQFSLKRKKWIIKKSL